MLSPDKNDEFKNYYKNVVYLSDKAVGRLLHHIKGTDKGSRTVILYTSDHGESFQGALAARPYQQRL